MVPNLRKIQVSKLSSNLEKTWFKPWKNSVWTIKKSVWELRNEPHNLKKKTQVQNLKKKLRFETGKKLGRFQTWKNNGFENSQSFEQSIYRQRLIQLVTWISVMPIRLRKQIVPIVYAVVASRVIDSTEFDLLVMSCAKAYHTVSI